jgi:ribonuclease HII
MSPKPKPPRPLQKPRVRQLKPQTKSPGLSHEKKAGYPSVLIGGVDEVGRGCLAGPVVAGALILPAKVNYRTHPWLRDVADSKLLIREERERLDPLIRGWAPHFAIGVASVEEIDRINIFHASHLAMVRAVEQLGAPPAHLLVDGKFLPAKLAGYSTAIIKGDLKCLSIACASILAKVFRDRLMATLDAEHPGYDFGIHKGYATPAHQRALKEKGACPIHRRSFAPVAVALGLAVDSAQTMLPGFSDEEEIIFDSPEFDAQELGG